MNRLMSMKRTLSAVLVTSVVLLAGCESAGDKQVLGGVLAAAGGGLLGSQFGGGSGKAAMTALGAVGGLLIGSSIGKSMDDVDKLKQRQGAQRAFETAPSGTSTAWSNPDSGASGSVTPTRTYQRGDGAYCREFTQTINVGGKSEQGYGTACRQPDGSWKIAG